MADRNLSFVILRLPYEITKDILLSWKTNKKKTLKNIQKIMVKSDEKVTGIVIAHTYCGADFGQVPHDHWDGGHNSDDARRRNNYAKCNASRVMFRTCYVMWSFRSLKFEALQWYTISTSHCKFWTVERTFFNNTWWLWGQNSIVLHADC